MLYVVLYSNYDAQDNTKGFTINHHKFNLIDFLFNIPKSSQWRKIIAFACEVSVFSLHKRKKMEFNNFAL